MTDPIYLVSGFYFPVKYIGAMVGAVASIIPITLGLDAMRQLLSPGYGDGFLPIWVEAVTLVVLCLVFFVLAKLMLDYMEMLGRREGRLTMRWQ